jgi:hypothetical protein
MSSVQLIGQGVVAGFSPKWLDTGEAADVDFGGSVPGSGGPHCRRWSPAGWCRTRRKKKKGAREGVRHWEQGERRCLHMILVSSGVGAGDGTDQR